MSAGEDEQGFGLARFETESIRVEWKGGLITAGRETHLFNDGTTHVHDKVWHPGAVAIVAFDEQYVWLVRQPRPASRQQACLEIPAGKRDRDDEPPLALAKRELAEEIGKQALDWRELKAFYPTPAFSDERMTLFSATGLSEADGGPLPDEDEYIEVVPWPLSDIDAAIGETTDAKTLVGLLWLARQLRL